MDPKRHEEKQGQDNYEAPIHRLYFRYTTVALNALQCKSKSSLYCGFIQDPWPLLDSPNTGLLLPITNFN